MQPMRMLYMMLAIVFALSACASVDNTVWIDVRSQDEYDANHLEDTILISHTEIADKIGSLNLSKDTPIRLFCRSGRRAGLATEALQALGYTDVKNVGGIEDAKKLLDGEAAP